jgi:leucyl-tRNA synthetase
LEIKQHLLQIYSGSILISFGTPLVASRSWKKKDIDGIEKELYKITKLLQQDIKSDNLINLAKQMTPAWITIDRLPRKITRPENIRHSFV